MKYHGRWKTKKLRVHLSKGKNIENEPHHAHTQLKKKSPTKKESTLAFFSKKIDPNFYTAQTLAPQPHVFFFNCVKT